LQGKPNFSEVRERTDTGREACPLGSYNFLHWVSFPTQVKSCHSN
jgi:hypothetical protein